MPDELIKHGYIQTFISHVSLPLYRNAYMLILSTGLTSTLGAVYWVLAARKYTNEIVGLNSALISAMMFVSGVAQLSLSETLYRFVPTAGRATRRLVMSAYAASTLGCAIVCILLLQGESLWSARFGFLHDSPWLPIGLMISTMSWSIFVLQDSVLTGLRRTGTLAIENLLFAIAKIVLLLLFATALPRYGVFTSWTIPATAAIIPINFLIFRRYVPRYSRTEIPPQILELGSQIRTFLGGNYLADLFLMASITLPPLIVTHQLGVRATATFYVCWFAMTVLQYLSLSMATSLTVEAASDETKLMSYSYHTIVHSARLLAPVVIGIVAAAPLLLSLFGSTYANEGSELLRFLVLSTIPNIVTNVYTALERVRLRTYTCAIVQGALCTLVLPMSYVLLPRHGLIVVGVVRLLSYTAVATIIAYRHRGAFVQHLYHAKN